MNLWYAFCEALPFEILHWDFMKNAFLALLLMAPPLESGEKRKTGSPMHPVCYCCNQPKSLTKDYPSKICGQRICFDCLKELGFNELFSSDERLAAFEGKEPFHTADDVIAELRRRKEQTEE